MRIRETGTSASVHSYSFPCRLSYLVSCVKSTTFGERFIASACCNALVERLPQYSRFHARVLSMFFPAMFFCVGLITCVYQFGSSSDILKWLSVGLVCVTALVSISVQLIDVILFWYVLVPIRVIWRLAFVMKADSLADSSNTFVTVDVTESHSLVDLSSEMQTLATANRLSTIKVMLYTPEWSARYVHHKFYEQFKSYGFDLQFVLSFYLALAVCWSCLYWLGSWFTEGFDVTKLFYTTLVQFGINAVICFIPFPVAFWVVVEVLRLASCIVNACLCGLPDITLNAVASAWRRSVMNRFRRDTSEPLAGDVSH